MTSLDANAQREAIHFKNRVLDLVDIYVKKQPSSAYIPLLVLPLLQLVITASPEENQLLEKATGILRSRIGKLKECPDEDETIDIGFILEDLHSKARHASSGDSLTTIGQCCCYLVRALNRANGDDTIRSVYRQSLEDFVTRKSSRLNSAFFQEFIRRCPEVAWDTKQDILDVSASKKAVNTYRRCQALGLLNLLFNNIPTKVKERTLARNILADDPLFRMVFLRIFHPLSHRYKTLLSLHSRLPRLQGSSQQRR
jgi:DNA polymerase phi